MSCEYSNKEIYFLPGPTQQLCFSGVAKTTHSLLCSSIQPLELAQTLFSSPYVHSFRTDFICPPVSPKQGSEPIKLWSDPFLGSWSALSLPDIPKCSGTHRSLPSLVSARLWSASKYAQSL